LIGLFAGSVCVFKSKRNTEQKEEEEEEEEEFIERK